MKSYIGAFLAPWAVVATALGQFKRYDDADAFVVHDTSRSPGGPAKRLQFLGTDPSYNCEPQALDIPIDDIERDSDVDVDLNEKAKTTALLNSAYLAFSNRVVTKAQTVIAVANLGAWANAATDPVAEINACIRTIATNTGRLPNRIAWGLAARDRFLSHAKVSARNPQTALIDGGPYFVEPGLFLNPAMVQMVSPMSKMGNPGVTPSKTALLGNDVFIFFAEDFPTQYDPSFMVTLTTGRGGISAVRNYRDDNHRSDVIGLDWSEDIQIMASLAGARITTNG